MLNKTLLGSAAVIMTMVGAQAADLPSKKAAPATYVKICDAYGAGFFFIPGTDTCVKLGGYVRYELQHTPGKDTLKYVSTGTTAATAAVISQSSKTQDTFGSEYRGRIDLDARTPTGYGAVRTFISLRGTGTSGLRKSAYDYSAGTVAPTLGGASNTELNMERAFIQWAGFTVGNATSNYAMIPSMTYTANGWAGFPNGQRQIAYTASFGGGFSATVALEDKQVWGNDGLNTNINLPDTPASLVGNIRLDQAWGFAAVHGVVGKHTRSNAATPAADAVAANKAPQLTYTASTALTGTSLLGPQSQTGWGVGTTVSFNLDQIAKGDKIWLTANYMDGWYGAILSSGSITSPSDGSSGGRTMGGMIRKDANVVYLGTAAAGYDTTTGWNVGGQFLHYWDPKWRSVFTSAYAAVNPPTQAQTTAIAWGKGTLFEVRGNLIYSPVNNFDIGVELQYLKNTNKLQNTATDTSTGNAAWKAAGYNGLNNSNWSSKIRVERQF